MLGSNAGEQQTNIVAAVRRAYGNVFPVWQLWRSQMATLARVISLVTGSPVDVRSLEPIVILCCIGLLVSLIGIKAYDLDLSVTLFCSP